MLTLFAPWQEMNHIKWLFHQQWYAACKSTWSYNANNKTYTTLPNSCELQSRKTQPEGWPRDSFLSFTGQPTIVSIHFNLSSALTGTRPSFWFGLHICIGIVPANEVTEFLDRRVPWFVTILLSYLSDTMKAVVLRNLWGPGPQLQVFK